MNILHSMFHEFDLILKHIELIDVRPHQNAFSRALKSLQPTSTPKQSSLTSVLGVEPIASVDFWGSRFPDGIKKGHQQNILDNLWLVVDLPSEKMSSSVGIILPNIWKNKSHVPKNQPDLINLRLFVR